MKTVLAAATLLATTALAIPAANALQIGVGGDLGVAVTIGGDEDTGINLSLPEPGNDQLGHHFMHHQSYPGIFAGKGLYKQWE